ncbi:helix-turn-helix domain-containing protein [Methylobacterium sp. A54F]
MTPSKPKQTTHADHSIGTRIAALRISRGVSQTALGTAIGVSFQQVQKYESGRNRVGAGRLQAIADLLEVPIATFFDEDESEASDHGEALIGLRAAGALDLVKAYSAIRDDQVRREVLALVKSAARLEAGRTES